MDLYKPINISNLLRFPGSGNVPENCGSAVDNIGKLFRGNFIHRLSTLCG